MPDVFCPHCGAGRTTSATDPDAPIPCFRCEREFTLRTAAPTEPERPKPARVIRCPHCWKWGQVEVPPEYTDADQVRCFACEKPFALGEATPPRRRRRTSARTLRRRSADRLRAPALLLSLVAIMQLCFHAVLIAFAVWDWVAPAGPRNGGNQNLFAGLGVVLLVKDVVVLAGVRAMERRRNHPLAHTGALFALCPDIAWAFSVPLAVWALVVLRDDEVKAAFEAVIGPSAAPNDTTDVPVVDPIRTPRARDASLPEARAIRNRTEVSDEELLEDARAAVKPAAILLSLVWLVLTVLAFILLGFVFHSADQVNAADPQARNEYTALVVGSLGAVLLTWSCLLGAVSMFSLRRRSLALVSAIILLVGSLGGCVAGLGIGVFAIVVLSRRDVKRAFALVRAGNDVRRNGPDTTAP